MTTKTLPQTSRSRAIVIALLAGLIVIAALFLGSRAPINAKAPAAQAVSAQAAPAPEQPVAVVTVIGKRMSPEQKAAFDRSDKGERLASRT